MGTHKRTEFTCIDTLKVVYLLCVILCEFLRRCGRKQDAEKEKDEEKAPQPAPAAQPAPQTQGSVQVQGSVQAQAVPEAPNGAPVIPVQPPFNTPSVQPRNPDFPQAPAPNVSIKSFKRSVNAPLFIFLSFVT